MTFLPDDSLVDSIREFLRNADVVDDGVGVRPSSLMPVINREKRAINKKVRLSRPLTDAEKWFVENYYLVYRYAYGKTDSMRSLPHTDGVPRVVALAKRVLNGSLNGLTKERIEKVAEVVAGVDGLTYAEVHSFEDAVRYAVLEQIFILSKRLLYADYCRKKAYKSQFNEKLLKSPTYVRTLFKIGLLTQEQKDKIKKRGLEEKESIVEYNQVLQKNAMMAKTLFSALREVGDYLPPQRGLECLSSYRVLSKTVDLSTVSLSTRLLYCETIEKIARSLRVNEGYCAKKAIELAEKLHEDVSIILFDKKRELCHYVRKGKIAKNRSNSTFLQRIYVASILLFTAASAALIGYFIDIVLGILSFLPLLFVVENVHNYLLSFLGKQNAVPACSYDEIPLQHSLAIVISEFISTKEQFIQSLSHADRVHRSNGGKNVETILLVDTPGGDLGNSDLDREVVDYLENNRQESGLNVFLRKKTWIDDRYQAKERKRGAILAINKLFVTGKEDDFYYIYDKNYFSPTYVMTLDADNELLPKESLEAVNAMAHPYNQRFSLLAFHSRYNLYSMKTPFSERFLSESGCERYPTFSGLYYSLFKRDIYCGKGIYRLKNFYNATEDVFPSGRILSHDILEGSVIKTASGPTVFEDAPLGFLSDRERKKRWMRGDIQLLPFVLGRWKNDEGKKCRVKIEPLNRFIMLKNIMAVLKETFLLAIVIYGLFSGLNALITALGIYLLPYAINGIKILRRLATGDLPAFIALETVKNVLNMLEDLLMLPYYGIKNSLIFFQTLIRMASGRNLLEWKTYYSSQKTRSMSSYARSFCLPVVAMTIVSGFSVGFLGLFGIWVCAYTILCGTVFIELYLSSKERKERTASTEERAMVRRYAEKTYKYFSHIQSFGAIIPDNLQIKPYKGPAIMTSPTNIGFSLLSHVCACRLGLISFEEASFLIDQILSEVEKLPKWRGNLYNWYDVRKKVPMNEFVSSVDCGNFCAALVVTKEFFRSHNDAVGAMKCELLLQQGDIKALYDEGKNLFRIGFDGTKLVGYYDLYNSESKILSVIFLAKYKNNKNFSSLARDFLSVNGKNVLLSWSGTAFETLMPELFIDSPKHSVSYDTASINVKQQIKNQYAGLWGISESGFYKFDDQQKYAYHAFGIEKLALRSERQRGVVAPYASALALSYDYTAVLENLRRLEKQGVLGEYGFYEAVDIDAGQNVVSSFMSHHQGMILCAMTNFLCDDAIKKYFFSDKDVGAVMPIFNEVGPSTKNQIKRVEKRGKRAYYEKQYSKIHDNSEQFFHTVAITDGGFSALISSDGKIDLKCGDRSITVPSTSFYDATGPIFVFGQDDSLVSPTYLPFSNTEGIDKKFSFDGRSVKYFDERKNVSMEVALLNGLDAVVLRADSCHFDRIFFHSSICLTDRDAYDSHPAFNGLFIDVTTMNDLAVFRRRDRSGQIADYYMAVRVSGVKNLVWENNDMNFIGRTKDLAGAKLFRSIAKKSSDDRYSDILPGFLYPSEGDVLYPCIGFYGEKDGTDCQVVMMTGADRDRLLTVIRSLPVDTYGFSRFSADGAALSPYTQDLLLGELLFRPYDNEVLSTIKKMGLQDDFRQKTSLKKLLVYTYSEEKSPYFQDFLTVLSDLRLLKIDVTVGVLFRDTTDNNVISYVKKCLSDFSVYEPVLFFDETEARRCAFLLLRPELTFLPSMTNKPTVFDEDSDEERLSMAPLPLSDLYISGNGGFDQSDAYVYHADAPSGKPYSNVVALRRGGYLLTDNGGGFFFFDNSRENKCNYFDNDPVGGSVSEYMSCRIRGTTIRLNDANGIDAYAIFDRGHSEIVKRTSDIIGKIGYYTICEGLGRVVEINVSDEKLEDFSFEYEILLCLDWRMDSTFIAKSFDDGLFTINNLKNGRTLYCKVILTDAGSFLPTTSREMGFTVGSREGKLHLYLVYSPDKTLISDVSIDNLAIYKERDRQNFLRFSNIDVVSQERSLNLIAKYLPYQTVSSRLYGRLGFYQVGGATGFRDQLQDSAAVLHADPSVCRKQIVESCLHQYKEGDVMHWWHQPKIGLRTKISDDKLFLPLIVTEYLSYTDDMGLLEETYPYLCSEPLRLTEESRYEDPPYTKETYSVMDHCLVAIKNALSFGPHGLVCMGTGDWNDGMDKVGKKGVGESVFTSMLLYEVLIKFSPFCSEGTKKELIRIAEEVKYSVNTFAFDTDRYKRLFTDDGRWLGAKNSPTLTLDLLVQSYAVISGICDADRADVVLNTAKSLVDREGGFIKLLDPPLTRDEDLGYLSSYPKGVRENGGQYTHAAMWYLIALTRMGRQDEAYELFQMINPVEKCKNKIRSMRYMAEPYVMAGDIYSNGQNYGQAGWSWYTGSAAWAYRLIVEEFFGLKRRGDSLSISPKLPKALDGTIVNYRYKNALYVIEYRIGKDASITVDAGEKVSSVRLVDNRRQKVCVTTSASG
ncbi:MAG: hypothetical protein IJ735_06130 [Clostridia bacterium]|nr:hypothetical protein [Clostridia bacterium]